MTDPVSDDSWIWVLARIASFEELHVLVTLAEQPDRRVPLQQLVLRHPNIDVEAAVASLVDAELVRREGGPSLRLADGASRHAVAVLLAQYRSDPLPIVRSLTERSLDRVRSAAVRTFADAFVFRKKDS